MKALVIYGALIALSIPVTNALVANLEADIQKYEQRQAERYELIQATLNH